MFVSITRPDQIKDRNMQKKINRHVMKPIGLARRRKPKNEKIELVLRPEGPSSSTAVVLWQTDDNVEYASNLYMRSIPSPRSADQELNYRHFSSRAHKILAFLREWDSPVCSMMRELSFTLAMMDDSAMHVALALTLVFAQEHKKHLLEESNKSLDHYNKSVSLVNQQITNIGNIVCDALVGVVITLACYDLCIFNLDRWVIHMTGLTRVVELRGGFHKISSRYLQTTIIWTSLTGSMMLDSPSFFEPAEEPLQGLGVSHHLGNVTSTLRKRLSNHPDICTLLESMSEFATATSEKSPWTNDPISKQKLQHIVSVMLKLPRYDILSVRDDGIALYEVLRLASLFFLSGPSMRLAGNKDGNVIISYHRGRLPILLRSYKVDWTGLEDLELWVLVIDGLVETGQDQEWVLGQISRTMLMRKLNWDDVLGAVARIAWADGRWTRTVDQLCADLEQRHGSSGWALFPERGGISLMHPLEVGWGKS
ncbi:hypothetical protein CEP54_007892 [Fusarium duplospermum]|uniref:Uncharacterized protein n=1 Tax=Fusarium duplospermum TaxID=1325734 RepID=A0A428PYV7_9HYPO|nr:hypothetical protein CEP54_007892 [Fusarium duplospermum]